jgi:hypothetical protein
MNERELTKMSTALILVSLVAIAWARQRPRLSSRGLRGAFASIMRRERFVNSPRSAYLRFVGGADMVFNDSDGDIERPARREASPRPVSTVLRGIRLHDCNVSSSETE